MTTHENQSEGNNWVSAVATLLAVMVLLAGGLGWAESKMSDINACKVDRTDHQQVHTKLDESISELKITLQRENEKSEKFRREMSSALTRIATQLEGLTREIRK